MILKFSVDRLKIITVSMTLGRHSVLGAYSLDAFVYSFKGTFFKLICLTAKTLHSTAMCGFLVGATKLEKRTFKRIQPRFPG